LYRTGEHAVVPAHQVEGCGHRIRQNTENCQTLPEENLDLTEAEKADIIAFMKSLERE
jgi:hypothetical protein